MEHAVPIKSLTTIAQKKQSFFAPAFVQPKLSIGPVDDLYEREADAMADKVMRMTDSDIAPGKSSPPVIQKKCAACEEEEKELQRKEGDEEEGVLQRIPIADLPLQRKCAACESEEKDIHRKESTISAAPQVSPSVHHTLQSGGQKLDHSTREFMESRFGYDFGHVQIHNDSLANQSSSDINALAYTHGNHIVFGAGQYQPNKNSGKQLLAHELTHVVQQGKMQRMPIQRQTANQQSNTASPEPLRFDVLGSDYPVNRNFAQAAALEPGIDLHVTSLSDLISQLSSYTNAGTNRCVGEINFWNHGSPNEQDIAGTEEITTKDSKKYKLPTQRLTLDFLLNEKNLASIESFRNLFCCNGIMRWLGCGTAGVEAYGGLRSTSEQKKDSLRYQHYGHRYQSVADAVAHGAKLEGAQFGFLNAQSWANAVCVDVMANNDFTYQGPSVAGHHYQPGFGGSFTTFHPDKTHCSCDPKTGRSSGNWSVTEGKKYVKGEEQKLLGSNYLWHTHLDTLRSLQRHNGADKAQLTSTLRSLLGDVFSKVSIPAGLPATDFEPWMNSNANTKEWAGATLPQLVFCFPDNCWHWIAFNQNIIKTTPEYTISAIDHELMHAADIWEVAKTFMASQGKPPVNPDASNCNPTSKFSDWPGDFGAYVKSFVAEYKNSVGATRHVDIYAASAKNNISNFTYKEIVDWFGAMLTELPQNLPAKTHLPAEDIIEAYFVNPKDGKDALRDSIADTLTNTAKEYLLNPPSDKTIADVNKGKAASMLNHFIKIWRLRIAEYNILKSALRDLN